MKQKSMGSIGKWKHTLHKHVGLMGIFIGVLFLVSVGIIVTSATTPTITDWNNTKTTDNPKDIMFLVASGDVITFSVIVNQSVDYTWEVDKEDQDNNQNSFTWTVPNEKGIWELHLKASNANGEDHREWVVSTLSIGEAPDFFDYFTDKKYTNRTETDLWGRLLPNWTTRFLATDVSKGFAESPDDRAWLRTDSTIVNGTWKFRLQFPNGYKVTPGGTNTFYYYFINGETDYKYSLGQDCHHHCVIDYLNGKHISMEQDANINPDKKWYDITIIRKDNWSYVYMDGILDFKFYEPLGNTSSYIELRLDRYNASGYPDDLIRVDDFVIYESTYIFPEKEIGFGEYVDRWYAPERLERYNYPEEDYIPYNRTGIIVNGRNVTLSDINEAISDPSKFEYNSTEDAYICYEDLVVGDGAELNIRDETLKIHCDYDGEHQFAVMFGAILRIENSTLTSDNEYYWTFRPSSVTHYGYPVSFLKSTPRNLCVMNYLGTQSIIISNSVINNSAHMFFDHPYELRITDSEITNLNEVDIGNYTFSGSYTQEIKARQDSRKGNKGIWIFYKQGEIFDFELNNVTITGKSGPINFTFSDCDDKEHLNIYNANLENENIVVRKGLHMFSLWVGDWPYYRNSSLGLVNCKFNDIIIQPEPEYYGSSLDAEGANAVVKYYLDVNVVDADSNPVSGANVTVINEVDDVNYPLENIVKEREGPKDSPSGWPHEWYSCYEYFTFLPLHSITTGADGHTPLPSDKEHTFVIADYVKDINGISDFTYNITISKNGKVASISGFDIDETWYREYPNTSTKTVVCNVDTGECWVETVTTDAPTTNVTITPAPNAAEVVVTFFRSDNSSGISYTNYSKTSETGPWTTVYISAAMGLDAGNVADISKDKFNVTVSDEGTTEIWYYSLDNNSNVETTKNVIVNINPVGEWHFDEDSGEIAEDTSVNNNNGTLTNMDPATAWVAGKLGTALEFDGADDYIEIPSAPSLNSVTSQITIEAWVKSDFAQRGTIVDNWYYDKTVEPAIAERAYVCTAQSGADAGKFSFGVSPVGDGTGQVWLKSTTAVIPGQWTHVAFVSNATNMSIYINGNLDAVTSAPSQIHQSNRPIHIGAWNAKEVGNPPFDTFFNGTLDELKIYNHALTTEEIQADYEASFVELNTLSGTVTSPCGTYIPNATVTLTTRAGAEINTTQTDSTGHYAFANVSPDYYDITATKHSYWSNTNNVTVTAEAPETADIVLCQKGDYNTNSEPADAGDLAMMADATEAGTSDVTYDLDGDGNPADEADLTLLKDVSVGVAELE